MEYLPQLITDLALILTAAALATIVCKRLNQPLILGYVLAGFLISPAIGWIPNIVESDNIHIWSEIGVIFLLFGLGLEFSIMKLARVGRPGIITAMTEVVLMVAAGYLVGTLLGWDFFTSIFLGGCLAISSTTIIVKAFDELGLKGKKFTNLVFGSLIIEDIAGIFIMVILSAIAVSTAIDGGAIAMQLGQMSLYLVIWLVLSVLIVPSFLKRVSGALTDEILLISSVALCMVMVLLAHFIGFSIALGAFLAGSIMAGTIHVHRTEKVFKPVKNFFGAIFFVSVGMLVSPQMIAENWIPIIVITIVTLLGKPIFTSLGALFGKQSLKTSVQTGFSLSQIGEFSFIIAALGVSLGVTEGFLYPIIVAVSVITTITTPFYIKNSHRIYVGLTKILPKGLLKKIDNPPSDNAEKKEEDSAWASYMKHWVVKILMLVVTTLAIIVLFSGAIMPFAYSFIDNMAMHLALVGIAVLIIGIFISNVFLSQKKGDFLALWQGSKRSRIPLILLLIADVIISLAAIEITIIVLEGIDAFWLIVPAVLLIFLFARSNRLHTAFLSFENLFIRNLNEAELAETESLHSDEDPVSMIVKQLQAVSLDAVHWRERRGRLISYDLIVAQTCGLDLIAVRRDGKGYATTKLARLTKEELRRKVNNPSDDLILKDGDELTFIGTEQDVDKFIKTMVQTFSTEMEAFEINPLAEVMIYDDLIKGYGCFRIKVDECTPFRGKTVADSRLKEDHGCLVIAMEHQNLFNLKPNRNTRISQNDYLWLFGTAASVKHMLNPEECEKKKKRRAKAE
ncbi:MAG: cation:proton antiporter [Coriobacteriia bacterium]|nr:cation:proton antiporter [Coriobacteriia bacterium]MCL2750455.1 cation:proton antiporter [Coriobacteriia bacterium]